MRRLLAWALYKIGRAYLTASRFVQGSGPGPWAEPDFDFRHQLAVWRVSANDE